MNFDEQEKQIAQRKAKYLRMQEAQSPSGRMVGNTFVAPNALEYLASGLRGYGGIRGEQMSDQEAQDLQTKKQAAMQGDMQSMIGALRGTPAQEVAPLTPNDDEGNVNPNVQMPAKPGSMDDFYRVAAGSQFPQFQQMGMTGAVNQAQEQAKRLQAQQEQQRMMGVLQTAKTPQEAMAAGVPVDLVKNYYDQGLGKEKGVVVNGQLVNPLTGAAIGGPIAKQPDMSSDLLIPDGKGGMMLNEPLMQAKKQLAIAGRAPAADRQVQTIQTDQGMMERINGKWVPITGADGKPVLKAGAGADKPLTEGQAKGSLYLGQMRGASKELENLETAGGTRKAQPVASPTGVAAAGSTWTNWAASKEAQKVAQIQNQWSEAFLRAKTGAAATPGEVELNNRTFFPVFGEDKETSAQKAKMRKQAEGDMEFVAGKGAAKAGQHPEGSWDAPASSGWSITPVTPVK